MHRRDQLVLRELQRVGRGQRRQQRALVREVVEDHDLAPRPGGGELAARVAVPDGDVEGQRGRPRRHHPATLTRPRTSVPSMVKKRRVSFSIGLRVGAVRGDVAVAVEQRLARHPHVVEVEPAVVDAGEAGLGPQSLDRDAGAAACRRSSRIGTRNACTPWLSPPVTSWANTTAIRPSRAALPM